MVNDNNNQEWRFYGRRAGRRLRGERQAAMDEIYPLIKIEDELIQKDGCLHPSSLFLKSFNRFILEIGFGNGERLAEHLQQEPETGFIGAEPFKNGVSAFLCSFTSPSSRRRSGSILEMDPVLQRDDNNSDLPKNIRVLNDDAIPLVRSLASASIDDIYVLNPDPWHKTRHHKRRLINQYNLDLLSRILKPSGRLIMTTDVRDLADWMVTHATRHPDFDWTAQSVTDWREPPKNWIPTRYETKGAKGADRMNYFIFTRQLNG